MEQSEQMLRFQLNRRVTSLFVSFLQTLESLYTDNDIMLMKIKENLGTDEKKLVDAADYLKPEKRELLRKSVLRAGNNCVRDIYKDLEAFEINDNFNR